MHSILLKALANNRLVAWPYQYVDTRLSASISVQFHKNVQNMLAKIIQNYILKIFMYLPRDYELNDKFQYIIDFFFREWYTTIQEYVSSKQIYHIKS